MKDDYIVETYTMKYVTWETGATFYSGNPLRRKHLEKKMKMEE
jgi:hypothetical protein